MSPADWRRIAAIAEEASTLAGYNGSCSLVVDTKKFTRFLREEADKQERAGVDESPGACLCGARMWVMDIPWANIQECTMRET